jgi:hypothetical protein
MKFELDRLPDYSNEALLAELRRVANVAPPNKLTVAEFSKHSKASITTFRRRFGSWPAALEAAGLSHLFNSIPSATKSRTLARAMSDAEMIEEVRRVARIVGRARIVADDLRQHACVGLDAIRNRFGSLKLALRAAGLIETAHGRRYTDDERFENLLIVWTYYGRPPKHKEMNLPPSTVGSKAYTARWQTWNKALHAFVERVNADIDENSQAPSVGPRQSVQTRPLKKEVEEQDRRGVRLGLRYTVLKRDNFKCILCGRSPALTPGVQLHIDHVFPFSKGGKTEIGNLRTLCDHCNLGKANRIE